MTMKMRLLSLTILASSLFLSTISGAFAISASAVALDTSKVYMFSPLGQVVTSASSTLVRTGHGVSMTIDTSGLPPGHPVTIWWVIFNKPENCSHGELTFKCGLGDVLAQGNPAEVSVMYAAGHMIGSDGLAGYGAHLAMGDTSGCVTVVPLPCGHGLTNVQGAHIHLVVHDHGQVNPNMISAAIHGFCPCTYPADNQGRTWRDIQFAVHEH